MEVVLHTFALIISGLFAGGAMMQTVVDHPARLSVNGACAVDQMQRSLNRADPYMPALATIGALTCFGAFLMGAPINNLFAALLFVGIGLHTFAFIIPINKQILGVEVSHHDIGPTLTLMQRWGFFHTFRSVAGLLALILLAAAGR